MREAGGIIGPIINEKAKNLLVFLHIEINKLYFRYWGPLANQVATLYNRHNTLSFTEGDRRVH